MTLSTPIHLRQRSPCYKASSKINQGLSIATAPPSSSSSTSSSADASLEVTSMIPSKRKFVPLKERNKPPPSFYLSIVLVFALQYFAGIYHNSYVIVDSLKHSFASCHASFQELSLYLRSLFLSCLLAMINQPCRNYDPRNEPQQQLQQHQQHQHQLRSIQEYTHAVIIIALLSSIFYVIIYSPFKAGMWTQPSRVRKHKLHRYFGLTYLILYFYAWMEFICNYDDSYQFSFIPHLIAMNGLVQVHSAYFSFKVLPDLADAGYYSDVAVLSRTFVHENSYFQLMTFFGSIYYGPPTLSSMLSSSLSSSSFTSTTTPTMHMHTHGGVLSKVLEYSFIFYPYVFLRAWFPITRFSNAGTSNSGRTKRNETFYKYGTLAIKLFYLWAKYFLGFYINFLVLLNNRYMQKHQEHYQDEQQSNSKEESQQILSYEDIKFIRGLYLLNLGTVSIAVFLHTLRFKKVLPPKLAFSIYLVQIYLTFLTIPYLSHLFLDHLKLVGLVLLGMICNMTRSRKIHAFWCVLCHYLLVHTDVEW